MEMVCVCIGLFNWRLCAPEACARIVGCTAPVFIAEADICAERMIDFVEVFEH